MSAVTERLAIPVRAAGTAFTGFATYRPGGDR